MPGTSMRVAHQVDGQPLLGAHLGEVEAGHRAVRELRRQMQPERERPAAGLRRRGWQRVAPLQPAAAGQMGDQVHPVEVEGEELAVARRTRHDRARQRR